MENEKISLLIPDLKYTFPASLSPRLHLPRNDLIQALTQLLIQLLAGKLYRVSAGSDSVIASHGGVFTGVLGSGCSWTDRHWERLSPGVFVLNPVNHTRERKNTTTGHKMYLWSLTTASR